MRRAALAGGLVVLLLGTVLAVRPFLTRDRELLTTTPQPPSLVAAALVELHAGQQACLDRAVVDERSEQARFRVGTFGRRSPPLRVTIRGRGYRQSARVASADYRDNDVLAVPVAAPDSAVLATVCIRDEGPRRIALYASETPGSRAETSVDGRRVNADVVLQFAEGRPRSLLEHVPVTLRRLTVLRPVGTWLLWPLAILFALAMPAGVLAAYVSAAGSAEGQDGEA